MCGPSLQGCNRVEVSWPKVSGQTPQASGTTRKPSLGLGEGVGPVGSPGAPGAKQHYNTCPADAHTPGSPSH